MKIRDLLESPFPLSDWVESNNIEVRDKHSAVISSSMDWIDGKQLAANVASVRFEPKKASQPFEWPLENKQHKLNGLELGNSFSSFGYVIENFVDFPNAIYLLINGKSTTIKSFKGIEHLSNLHTLKISDVIDIDCGVLRILKSQALALNILNVTARATERAKEYNKLSDIMNKHLFGDRNVAECQQELIEEGLQEFAKL